MSHSKRTIGDTTGITASIAEDFQVRFAQNDLHLKSLSEAIDKIGKQLSDHLQAFNESRRTDWKTLLSWASAILIIVGLYTSGYDKDQTRLEASIQALTTISREQLIRNSSKQADAEARLKILEKLVDSLIKENYDRRNK
jgi:trans-2-enoyl-CoA reductase